MGTVYSKTALRTLTENLIYSKESLYNIMLTYGNFLQSIKGEILTLVTPTPLPSIIKNDKNAVSIISFY